MAHPSFSPAPCYRDTKAALDWLEKAFGFEPSLVIVDGEGNLAHAEMRFGDGVVMIASEWTADHKSPASIGGSNTQSIHVQLTEDVDAHCARAGAAGAQIVQAPSTQFYGDRTYRAKDLEGHIWTFGQTVKETTSQDWEAEMGLKTLVDR